jgi:hypothetical protein
MVSPEVVVTFSLKVTATDVAAAQEPDVEVGARVFAEVAAPVADVFELVIPDDGVRAWQLQNQANL